ncbi:uncharacterized protein EMH_0057070 [Eimeria mitis]|uniref:Uncharacterized protein n=1 Tax=Eimeria mitis TaxID=44415 RepID=U6K1X1_9EIME|nr:uncharacterized protein EMH_0057070 [Eimeria mitis]CDJ30312.1 hypothetical protein EMH_0057070 [Eimeria mitis]
MDRKRSASYALDEKPTESITDTSPATAQTHMPNASGDGATPEDVVRETQASDLSRRSSDHLPQSQQQQSGAAAAPDAAQMQTAKRETLAQSLLLLLTLLPMINNN